MMCGQEEIHNLRPTLKNLFYGNLLNMVVVLSSQCLVKEKYLGQVMNFIFMLFSLAYILERTEKDH